MGKVRDKLRQLSSRGRVALTFTVASLVGIALDRLLKQLVPEGQETNYLFRVLGWVRDLMAVVPTDWLLVAAATAFGLYAWDERTRWISAIRSAAGRFRGKNDSRRHVFVAGGPTGRVATVAASSFEVDGPITWEFGSNTPIGTSRSAGSPLWVDAFHIKARNTSDGPVHARKAEVRSDISGRTLPLLFAHDGKLLEPETITIPPGAKFILIGKLPATDLTKTLGIVVDQFREEFGAFTFTFEYGDPNYHYGDRTTFTRRFPWAEVDKLLTNADVQSRPPNDRDIIIRKPPHYARATVDYDNWDGQNVLSLFEAACLWNEEEPSLPMREAALRTFWEFHKAIYERRLGTKANLDEAIRLGMAQTGWPREPSEYDPVNVNTKVSRQHLKPYAEKAGVKPKLLYSDQRAGRRPS